MSLGTFLFCSILTFLLGFALGGLRFLRCAEAIYAIMRRFKHDRVEANLMAALDTHRPEQWPRALDELTVKRK